MTYLNELRQHWRTVAATSLGLASGYALNLYVSNLFAPHLLKEFGWTKAQFALTGVSILLAVIALPVAGRMADRYGSRRLVQIGIIINPLIYVLYSQMTGSFAVFFMLNLAHVALGSLSTTLVYSRLIAERFDRCRGLALAIAGCSAPAAGGLIAGSLTTFIELNGWREGYLLVAAGTAAGGLIAYLLIPRGAGAADKSKSSGPRSAGLYREIARNPAFPKIAVGMFLCNLTVMVQSSQLKLILVERGLTPETAATMLMVYAVGIIIGRLSCGLALDAFPTHVVAAISLGLPAAGLTVLASGTPSVELILPSVLIVGLCMGAELDVLGYLVMRYFRLEVYGTVFGIVQPIVSFAAAVGSLLLSMALSRGYGFSGFLYLAALLTLAGSLFFLQLGKVAPVRPIPAAKRTMNDDRCPEISSNGSTGQ